MCVPAVTEAGSYQIGAHVKRGDVLAQIETPELDQQLREAQAQLAQMQVAVVEVEAILTSPS